MKNLLIGASFLWPLVAGGAARSGHAEVELIVASNAWQAGVPLKAAVRMKLDPGWHTYWINPGEGGMKLSVVWSLPAGWAAGELQHPVPIRFMTGDLPGFGYEGEVVFPVVLTPPPAGEGVAEFKAEISWLSCDDGACVPGDAVVLLKMAAGEPAAGEHAGLIDAALTKVARPLAGAVLEVVDKENELELRVEWPEVAPLDLAKAEVFPQTVEVVDAGALIRFERADDAWVARARKSEYAVGPINELDLVLAGDGGPPVLLRWRAP